MWARGKKSVSFVGGKKETMALSELREPQQNSYWGGGICLPPPWGGGNASLPFFSKGKKGGPREENQKAPEEKRQSLWFLIGGKTNRKSPCGKKKKVSSWDSRDILEKKNQTVIKTEGAPVL